MIMIIRESACLNGSTKPLATGEAVPACHVVGGVAVELFTPRLPLGRSTVPGGRPGGRMVVERVAAGGVHMLPPALPPRGINMPPRGVNVLCIISS